MNSSGPVISSSSEATSTHRTPMGKLCSALLIGASVSCILAVAAGAWLGGQFATERLGSDRQLAGQAVTSQVTTALEPLLNSGDVTAARRVILELGRFPGVEGVTLSMPDGKIVADSTAKQIEVVTLPSKWGGPVDAPTAAAGDDASFILQTINVRQRGQLLLRINLRATSSSFGIAEYTGFGLVTVITLLLTLLAVQQLRKRIAGIALVGEALHALATAQEPLDQLRVNDTLGPEAKDWNRVLDHFSGLQRDGTSAAARSMLSDGAVPRAGDGPAGGNADLFAAIDLLPTGVLVLDDQCRVRTANGAGASLLGMDRTSIIGTDVRTLIAAPEFVEPAGRASFGTERRTMEIDRSKTGGGIIRVNVRPLRREDQGGALVTVEDVTQQRIADASRNQFVAQATHELRAPLTNMRLCLESALDEDTPDVETITTHLNQLNDETRRLERLVSEMLSVAEIEAGSLSLKADDVKLDRVFEELRADHAKACTEKNLQLTFELPPKYPLLRGDRDKLAAALHNLLNNAVKYTPAGGRITIAARQDGDRFVIDIADTGFGIPADDQPRVFERFFRAKDPRVAKITGTGLGLALSREVARLHGGELTFKSEHNRGTTFTLQLPVALQPA